MSYCSRAKTSALYQKVGHFMKRLRSWMRFSQPVFTVIIQYSANHLHHVKKHWTNIETLNLGKQNIIIFIIINYYY